jgi:hypothetical protein
MNLRRYLMNYYGNDAAPTEDAADDDQTIDALQAAETDEAETDASALSLRCVKR